MQKQFFCEAGRRLRRLAAGSKWIFSGIFDKVGSSGLKNILQDFTFGFFTEHLVGGAQRRPLILWLAARGAARQAEVRNPLRFCICFALKKNFCYNELAPTNYDCLF
jgi:hypothetical protein